jgi:hypothetical protein
MSTITDEQIMGMPNIARGALYTSRFDPVDVLVTDLGDTQFLLH